MGNCPHGGKNVYLYLFFRAESEPGSLSDCPVPKLKVLHISGVNDDWLKLNPHKKMIFPLSPNTPPPFWWQLEKVDLFW